MSVNVNRSLPNWHSNRCPRGRDGVHAPPKTGPNSGPANISHWCITFYIDRTPPQTVVLKLQNVDSEFQNVDLELQNVDSKLQTIDLKLQNRAKMAENSRHQGSATAERINPQHPTNLKRRVALCLDSLTERPT